MIYTLKNEHYTMSVSTLGAEMISLQSPSGYEFMWQKEKDYWHMQAPILFPLCGSLPDDKYTYDGKTYEMGLHGFILESEFTLNDKGDNFLEFETKSNERTRKIYPFDFTLKVRYTLDGEKINWSVTVTNDSGITMPYLLGWHPGFNLPTDEGQDVEDYVADFGSLEKLIWCPYIDGKFITDRVLDYPLKDGKFNVNEAEILANDTLIFTGHENRVKFYAPGHSFLIDMEWSENLPTLCFWKQETHEAKMMCIEPWCYLSKDGITNGDFNLRKLLKLESGKSESFSCTVKIKR